jgi:tetratricopeptide (TPR) repeat protein
MPDSAAIYFSRAIDLDPSLTDASLSLARVRSQQGDRESAEAIYRGVVQKGDDTDHHDSAVYRLFSLYWGEEDTELAVGLARTAAGHVRDPWILNALANTLAEAKVELSLAESLARKAVDGMDREWIEFEYPEVDRNWAETTGRRFRGYMFATLGFVHVQNGEMDKAILAFEQGIDMIPYVDSEILTKLAGAYRAAGRLDEAIESLLDILAISMNDEALAQLESIYTEKYGDTTGVHALVTERREQSTEPATDFRMTSLTGETVSLSDFKGNVVLLNFWFPT